MPSTVTDRRNGLTTSVAVKAPCAAVGSSNISLEGLQSIGSVTVEAGDRVLLIGQTDPTENGIYVADTGDWTRARDFDGYLDAVQGTLVLVRNQFVEGAFYELTTENPVSFGTSSITFILRDSPNRTFPQTQVEIDAGVTPTDFSWPEGDMRRYSTIAQGFLVLQNGGRRLTLEADTTYSITSRLALDGVSNFEIDGNGATIFAANGSAVGSGTQLLFITDASDFRILDLTLDANRANRTPAETSAHSLHLNDCQRFELENVSTPNAVTDGIRLDAGDVSDITTYCRDFSIENCYSDNAYRNGMGIINAWDGEVTGGAYTNANGTAPECGIDVESNDNSVDPGNRSIRFYGVRCTGNEGFQLVFSSKDASYGMLADGCYFSGNGGVVTPGSSLGGVTAGAQSTLIACEFDGFATSGAIGLEASANANARIRALGCWFRNFSTGTKAVDDGSTTAWLEISNCTIKDVASGIDASGLRFIASNNDIDTCSGIAISVGTGTKASVCFNRINAATGRAVLSTGTYGEYIGNRITDVASVVGAYMQAEGAGNVFAFNTYEASSAQATTIGLRAHHDANAIVFNRCINLHTTQPYSIQGTEASGTAYVAHNMGGTSSTNIPKTVRFASRSPLFTNATRPAATTVPIGGEIWNTDDNAPNYSDGTNWRDAAGIVT